MAMIFGETVFFNSSGGNMSQESKVLGYGRSQRTENNIYVSEKVMNNWNFVMSVFVAA